MTTLRSLLAALLLCSAPAQAQTLKSLMWNTTNGQVVANTGTNVLTFASSTNGIDNTVIKFKDFYSGQEMHIVVSDESLTAGYPAVSGSIGVGGGDFQVNYDGSSGAWARPLLLQNVEDESTWVTVSPSEGANDTFRFTRNISFNNTTNAAITRTNLGLGATSDVAFDVVRSAYGFRVQQGTNIYVYIGDDVVEMSVPLDIYAAAGISFAGSNAVTSAATTRTNLGLGGGITATNTFVSYNGTNYTTNTVTISNGIITGWTQ